MTNGDGIVTYEDQAKWLRPEIRAEIEMTMPCPVTGGGHGWTLVSRDEVMQWGSPSPARIDEVWECALCERVSLLNPTTHRRSTP